MALVNGVNLNTENCHCTCLLSAAWVVIHQVARQSLVTMRSRTVYNSKAAVH